MKFIGVSRMSEKNGIQIGLLSKKNNENFISTTCNFFIAKKVGWELIWIL